MTHYKPIVMGLSGTTLTADEKSCLKNHHPLGVILFARNVDTLTQVEKLVGDVKNTLGYNAPIFIDQEGGRVRRLRPPLVRAYPPLKTFGDMWRDNPQHAKHATYLNHYLMARDLLAIGIQVPCAPVLDIKFDGMSDVVGDRSFGADIDCITQLGQSAITGLQSAGACPVIKHIPGHGRSVCDSHDDLPIVDTPRDILQKTDFQPFAGQPFMGQDNNNAPLMAMVSHLLYQDIDDKPASCSSIVISDIIRNHIGFTGLLVSDDIDMGALSKTRTTAIATQDCLGAGCDVVLQCSGKITDAHSALESCAPNPQLKAQWLDIIATLEKNQQHYDVKNTLDTLANYGILYQD